MVSFVKKTMANKQIDMRKAKRIYKLYGEGASKRRISKELGISRNTVAKYIEFFKCYRLILGDDPGGDPQALQGGPKAQERTAEDLRAVHFDIGTPQNGGHAPVALGRVLCEAPGRVQALPVQVLVP